MIESVKIKDVASYTGEGQVLENLSEVNFLFGSNGTGKTTISRVIEDPGLGPECGLEWKGDNELEAAVYNRDFQEKNFDQVKTLDGVFTLGEKSIETKKRIEELKGEIEEVDDKISGCKKSLNGSEATEGKRKELQEIERRFEEDCWRLKTSHDEHFKEVFKGYRSSKAKFKDKLLDEEASNNQRVLGLDSLIERSERLFDETLSEEEQLSKLSPQPLVQHESNPILQKAIVGASDVDIASLIEKLGNSDWVRTGRDYLNESGDVCPFCQQPVKSTLEDELREYFGDEFERDKQKVEGLLHEYQEASRSAIQQVREMDKDDRFVDIDALDAATEKAIRILEENKLKIESKVSEPSKRVSMKSTGNIIDRINDLIKSANDEIRRSNEVVSNLQQEKSELKSQVWRYVVDEAEPVIQKYRKDVENVTKAINGIEGRLQKLYQEKENKEKKVERLEEQVTSITPTATEINKILDSFGFKDFSLAETDTDTGYQLVRPDGSNAKQTLSEGEKTFVTFLYFYHLLKGSAEKTGATKDRIVVFDDPVSSLDSDVLFVVSSLIRRLCDKVGAGNSQIKQVFVLTHNVYFYRQLTFRHSDWKGNCSFWVVRKNKDGSYITGYDSNPIRSSYELLWGEVYREDNSDLVVQNAMRRIIEYYFKFLGGFRFNEIEEELDGVEKKMCKSLISWLHAGSHDAGDDVFVRVGKEAIDAYKKVFKKIFTEMGHKSHFEMMKARLGNGSS